MDLELKDDQQENLLFLITMS